MPTAYQTRRQNRKRIAAAVKKEVAKSEINKPIKIIDLAGKLIKILKNEK